MVDIIGVNTFKDRVRQMETTDLAHPNSFNPIHTDLINNDVYLQTALGGKASVAILDPSAGHKHTGVAGDAPILGPLGIGIYGNGSDGVFNSTGNTTWAVGADDGGPIVKQFTSFTLNAGHTLTVDRRCKGLIIFCTGDVIISGTISMDNKAARVTRNTEGIPWVNYGSISYVDSITKTLVEYLIPAGGNGGQGGANNSGSPGGAGGSNCAYGGCGGGGGTGGTVSATKYNGAPGGVGGSTSTGGVGGAGAGGASAGTAGGAGGGGIVVIIAKGNIVINSGGVITASSTQPGGNSGNSTVDGGASGGGGGAGNGGAGGAGYSTAGWSCTGGGGGGAGGGVVVLIYGGSYTNNGAIMVNGSSGGTAGTASGGINGNHAGQPGSPGQAGSIITIKAAV